MHHARTANKRPDESDHKINGVIGGKNAEVAHSRPEGIPGGQRFALLQIVVVSKHAALGLPACAGGIYDASRVFPLARHENWLALALEIFPAESTAQIRAGRGFGD